MHSYLFLSLLHILLYTSLLILDLWAEKEHKDGKIDHKNRYETTAFSFLWAVLFVVHTCWFCLNRVRASWSMYFLSVSVSLVTPLCACQVRAMRNTLMYSDNTVLRVEAIIGAPKQQLPSRWRGLSCTEKKNGITTPVCVFSVYNDQSLPKIYFFQGWGWYNNDYVLLSFKFT